MEIDDLLKALNADHILLEVSENPLSDKTEVVKNLITFNRFLFSQKCLDKSLLSCCRKGIILIVPDIISAGANLEVTDENGNTPLLVSALCSNENCIRYLLGAGAKVNGVNSDGNTPLIASIMNCLSTDIIKTLVGSKDTNIDHVNNKGYTALLYAIETTNFNAIKLLIDAGASSESNTISRKNVFKNEASKKSVLSLVNLLKLKTVKGKSPLLHAVLNRDLESAKIMISMDKSILKVPKDSFASITIPFLKSIQNNNNIVNQPELDMFDFLLTQVTANSQNYSENEMIMDILISIGDCELVERLLRLDFIISYNNLSSAVYKPEFLCFLLTKKHVINKLNRQNKPVYKNSPLQNAMMAVELKSAKSLIQHGAYMDLDQALEDAVKWKQEKVLQFLLSEFPGEVQQKLKSLKLLNKADVKIALNIILVLLDNGVDIKSTDGNSPLNILLAKRHIGTENVKRLIKAGCDVNHVNKDGNTALIHAAKYVDIKLLELVIQEGADVNASGRKYPHLNALTVMLSKIWDNPQRATLCIKYLLDQKVNFDKIHSGAIHVLITCRCLSLIPRFISRGLAPTYLSIDTSPYDWYKMKKPTSPLMMALLLNQSDLARYFINIGYLMKTDIAVLYGNRDSQILIEQQHALNSLKFLKNVCQGPFSLETLCLVVISDTLGATQDRRSKVLKLEIPQTLQHSLLFKNAPNSSIKDVGYENGYYFNQSLDQLHH